MYKTLSSYLTNPTTNTLVSNSPLSWVATVCSGPVRSYEYFERFAVSQSVFGA